jgi:hypothetical protein
MTINGINETNSLYSGYFQSQIRKMYEAGKVNPDNEEIRVQKKLEEERKKVWPVESFKGKLVDRLA